MKIKSKRFVETIALGLALAQCLILLPSRTTKEILQDGGGMEDGLFSPMWSNETRVYPGDFPLSVRQNFHGGLHPGGREFSLLRSKNPICETAGWIALL